ncbi:MAG: hypothetical protein GXO56_00840 [Chloroflexi bacterium]|nr:hypothetical protein [Chloroflexota bacterium]
MLRCPNCDAEVSIEERYCPQCGVHLGMAAAMAERKLRVPEQSPAPEEAPFALEALVPRLGERLVQEGLITPAQLEQALAHQRELAEKQGTPKRLGQVLVELGFISREDLDRVVAEQIAQLHEALYQANAKLEQKVQERTRQLQDALERLSELQRLKANFIANISHELRTPLTHLIGYLDLLGDGFLGDLNPDQAKAIEVMQRSADRLYRLIEDLISFSLLSRGELVIRMAPTLVDSVVERAVEVIKPRAHAKSVTFSTDVQQGLWVFADGEKIGWVLQHLLDNAVKFTPAGGQVWLRVWSDDGRVYFSVEDTGIGISQEDIDKIFEPFFQLEDSGSRRYGGTGLGLALVKQILDAHKVDLEVWSEVGKGSRFSFSLPETWPQEDPAP